MQRPTSRALAALLLAGGAALAACAGPGAAGPPETATATAPVATSTAPPATPPPATAARTASPARATADTAASPVVFVRKIDTSANPLRASISLAVDGAGNVYILDQSPWPQIQKYDAQGRFVTKWGGDGAEDGQLHTFSARFNGSGGYLAIDRAGDLWVADTFNYRLQHFAPDGRFVGKFGTQGTGEGEFSGPGPFAVDADDNLYVGDLSGRILKFDPRGQYLATLARPGTGHGEFSGSVATRKAIAAAPAAIDRQGNLYVGDGGGGRIQKLDRDGRFLLAWGSRGTGAGQFATPYSVALDPQGNVYVADGSTRIQKFAPDGRFLGQWGDPGNGEPPFAHPIFALAIDAQGHIFVAMNYDPTSQGGSSPSIYVFRPR